MILPEVSKIKGKTSAEVVQLRGVNYTDVLRDGDLAESHNLSTARYPYITVRNKRTKLEAHENISSMGSWEKLVVVKGNKLFYDGKEVGEVEPGEKQFAMVNSKLVVFPDKVYYDVIKDRFKEMYATITLDCDITAHTALIKVNSESVEDLLEKFEVGETVDVKMESGSDVVIDGRFTFSKISDNGTIRFRETTGKENYNKIWAEGVEPENYHGQITFTRKIPNLDFICESENRLWGCCNEDKTIYASALGEPMSFYDYSGLSVCSYAVAVSSEGDFTGCAKMDSSVLFFKEDKIHKVMGSYPAEYQIYTLTVDGLRKGCNKSVRIKNETMFYVGKDNVMSYSGGVPTPISQNLDGLTMRNARAGFCKDTYYVSFENDSGWHLYSYDSSKGIWINVDDTHVVDFTNLDGDLLMLKDDGYIYNIDAGESDRDCEWWARFTPFYETIQGRKVYSKILIRLQLPKGSWVRASMRMDNGRWMDFNRIYGNVEDVVSMRLPVNRCDKFEVKLSGKGQCTILQMLRQYSVGSDV